MRVDKYIINHSKQEMVKIQLELVMISQNVIKKRSMLNAMFPRCIVHFQFPIILFNHGWSRGNLFGFTQFIKFLRLDQVCLLSNPILPHVFIDCFNIFRIIMGVSEVQKNIWECVVLFLHFLVMAPALFSFPTADKSSHCLEDFIKSPHFLTDKVVMVNF